MTDNMQVNNDNRLNEAKLTDILQSAIDGLENRPETVLVIHPDYTRVDYTDVLFPLLLDVLTARGTERVDTLNAAGTHAEMTEDAIREKLGITDPAQFPVVKNIFNHHYYDDSELQQVGTVPAEFVSEQTQGRLEQKMHITANRRLFCGEYDLIVGISGTSPHEAAGYAGGLKVFFPGVSGPQVIGLLHWAAVLVGIPDIIGQIDNPARNVINNGSEFICTEAREACAELLSLNMVFDEDENHNVVPGQLFGGTDLQGFKDAYRKAARASNEFYLVEIDRPLDVAVQMIGPQYDEIWTAGKGSYKLQPRGVMADGGQIIIHAPHIEKFHSNETMDRAIRTIGYRTREDVLQWLQENPSFKEEFADDWQNVASHVINVNGDGTFAVTLATGIPEDECREANLNYLDPDDLEQYLCEKKHQGNNVRRIEDGGKRLYMRAGSQ